MALNLNKIVRPFLQIVNPILQFKIVVKTIGGYDTLGKPISSIETFFVNGTKQTVKLEQLDMLKNIGFDMNNAYFCNFYFNKIIKAQNKVLQNEAPVITELQTNRNFKMIVSGQDWEQAGWNKCLGVLIN